MARRAREERRGKEREGEEGRTGKKTYGERTEKEKEKPDVTYLKIHET